MDLSFLQKEFPGQGVITNLNGKKTWQLSNNSSVLSVCVVGDTCYNVTIASNAPTQTTRYFITASVVAVVKDFLKTA